MSSTQIIDALNQLLQVHYRSLPMYLTNASPWIRHGEEKAVRAVEHIVGDHQRMSRRIVEAIQKREGRFELGEFSMGFTDLNDLSLDFLITELMDRQESDLKTIEACAARLSADPDAKALAHEAIGLAKGHLQTLEELAGELTGAS